MAGEKKMVPLACISHLWDRVWQEVHTYKSYGIDFD